MQGNRDRRHLGMAVALCGLAVACVDTFPPGTDTGTRPDVAALTRHGDYPSALAELRQAPETAATLLDQANLLAQLGRFDEVQTSLARVAAMLPSDLTLRSSIAIIRARVSLGQGDTEAATRHARRALDLLLVDDRDDRGASQDANAATVRLIHIEALVVLCRANVIARRVTAAQPFCDEAVEHAAALAEPGLTTLTLLAETEARLAGGDASGAASLAEEAIGIASSLEHTPYQLHALSLAARAYGHLNDRRERRFRTDAASATDRLVARWGAEAVAVYLRRLDLETVLRSPTFRRDDSSRP